MNVSFLILSLNLLVADENAQPAPMPSAQVAESPAASTEKEIRYQKDTLIDLSGSEVKGDGANPPAFFVTKNQTPNAASLLAERLKFELKHYNDLGF